MMIPTIRPRMVVVVIVMVVVIVAVAVAVAVVIIIVIGGRAEPCIRWVGGLVTAATAIASAAAHLILRLFWPNTGGKRKIKKLKCRDQQFAFKRYAIKLIESIDSKKNPSLLFFFFMEMEIFKQKHRSSN